MHMKPMLMKALLGASIMAAASPGHAQVAPAGPHFTFTVPLRLFNLPPEITGYVVSCSVSGGPGTPTIMARGEVDRRGWGPTPTVAITGGTLSTDVVVPVTVTDAFRDPALATSYGCYLTLTGSPPPRTVVGLNYMTSAGTSFPTAPGTLVRQGTIGAIPP
jgi:hypothetical protein